VPTFTMSYPDCQKIRADVLSGTANVTLRYFYNCTNTNPNYGADVVWGKNQGEGDFSGGLNNWVVDKPNTWDHNPTGQITKQSFSADVNVNSFTTCTGVAEFNSDFLDNGGSSNFGSGLCPSLSSTGSSAAAPCTGELISPIINLTGTPISGISIEFSQAYRSFSSEHFLIASKNGGTTWTDTIKINNEASIYNGRTKVILKGYAGITQLRFKFRYESQYYYWAIDDVVVINEAIPDTKVNRNFYAVAPSIRVPKTQVSAMPFLADISSVGSKNATDVRLEVVISSGTQELKRIVNNYGNVNAGLTVENKLFPETYTPPATPAVYDGLYITKSANEIATRNDTAEFFFEVTENTFGSLLPEAFVTPANYMFDIAEFWAVDDRITKFYSAGNIYFLPQGKGFTVDKVRFGLENTKAEVDNSGFVVVDLFEWNDINSDGTCTLNERTLVGTNSLFLENIPNLRKIEIPLWKADIEGLPEENKKFDLKDNTNYVLMAHTNPIVPTATRYKFLTYSGQDLASEFDRSVYTNATDLAFDSLKVNRTTGSLWAIDGADGTFEDMRGRTFDALGNSVTLNTFAMMYLEMDVVSRSSTYEIAEKGEANIFPNPASTELYIDVKLEKVSKNVRVDILTVDGKLATSANFSGIQEDRLKIDLSDLVSGTYNALIHTDHGVISRKVVVQK
jgi:Secretion system C-terminal sorting domain